MDELNSSRVFGLSVLVKGRDWIGLPVDLVASDGILRASKCRTTGIAGIERTSEATHGLFFQTNDSVPRGDVARGRARMVCLYNGSLYSTKRDVKLARVAWDSTNH